MPLPLLEFTHMSMCPLCHAPVKDDFGLLECAGCGAQLLVHMDGRVEYQGAKESSQLRESESQAAREMPAEPAEPMREFDLDFGLAESSDPADSEPTQMRTTLLPDAAEDLVPPVKTGVGFTLPEDDLYDANQDYTNDVNISGGQEPPPLPNPDPEPETMPESEYHAEPEKEFLGAADPDPQDDKTVAMAAPATDAAPAPADDMFADFDAPSPPTENVYSSAAPSSPNLGDVANFGNSEMSGGREGPLRYNLFIEGIDTVDVREAFREAITDRKLMWDTDQILRAVRNGCVNIPNVAPTKAYILITRLRGMPVQVRWEQYAISQT